MHLSVQSSVAVRALFLFAVLVPAAVEAAITPPQGELRRDNVADYAPEPLPSRAHNEFWTYQLRLNETIQVQLNLSRVYFGKFKDPVCGADLAIMNFSGRNYFVAREYPLRNFVWDPVSSRLAVHDDIFAEGLPPRAHRVTFSTRKGGHDYFLDLTFDNMTPGVVWGSGVFRFGDGEQAALYLHIPKSRVRGRFGVDGDTIAVRGFGWMDHTRQTQFGTAFMDAGYRYAVTSGRAEGGFFFQNGSAVFGYGVREENGVMTLLKPSKITVSEKTSWGGLAVPKRLEIGLLGRDPVMLLRTEDRQRTSVLSELSSLERFGAKMYLGGEILGYRGVAKIDDNLSAIYAFTMVKR
jgi:hypothetical protein